MATYLPRIVDGELKRHLEVIGAVVIEGPKACGKTATATQLAKTVFRLDEDPAVRSLIKNAPQQLFDNNTPILFDEWQVKPDIWNRVRRQVDDRQGKGLYILTGSATPNDDATRHSGAGRVRTPRRMRPGTGLPATSPRSPKSTCRTSAHAATQKHPPTPGLARTSSRTGREVDRTRHGRPRRAWSHRTGHAHQLPVNAGSTAPHRQLGGMATPHAIPCTAPPDTRPLLPRSIPRPRCAQHRQHRAPCRHKRARLALRGAGHARPAHLRPTASRNGRPWRDSNGHEVDAIISVRNNKWGAFEIKLGHDAVEEAAESLVRFTTKVDTSRHGEPAFLSVIISNGSYAYRREDGVHVIPIGCLGP